MERERVKAKRNRKLIKCACGALPEIIKGKEFSTEREVFTVMCQNPPM